MRRIEKFNEETRKRINNYINEMNDLIPGLFSNNELLNLILEGLEKDIMFNSKLPENVQGQYSSKNLEIFISDNVKTESEIDQVLFHEFTHAITNKIYKDDFIRKYPYITEILITTLERKYVEKKTNKKIERVNGYISNFCDQLETIYGDELIKNFLKDPLNIRNVIYSFSLNMKTSTFDSMVKQLQFVKNALEKCADETTLKGIVENLEKNIFFQLNVKVALEGLTSENLNLLNTLYQQQFYPQSDKYAGTINNLESKDLDEYKVLKILNTIDSEQDKNRLLELITAQYGGLKMKRNTKSSINVYLAKKIFGFPDDISDIEEELSDEDIDLYVSEQYKLLENEEFYFMMVELLLHNVLDINQIGEMTYKMEKTNDRSFYDELKSGGAGNSVNRLYYAIFGQKFNLSANVLYLNDEIQMIINRDKSIYRPSSIEDILKLKDEFNEKGIDKVTKLLEDNNIDNIYVDSSLFDYIDEEDDFCIYMYRCKNDDIYRVKINIDKEDSIIKESKIELGDSSKITSSFSSNKNHHK